MTKKLDRINVIDIEATCWQGTPPPGEEQEIIEIGLCVVDVGSGQRLKRESFLIKPERSCVSAFCTELTTLTQRQVERDGMSFERACAILRRRYGVSQRIWASYGDYDRRQFEKQCGERGIDYPFSPTHINVKNLFAVMYALPREVGLLEALGRLCLTPEGTHHRGVDDAWNTGLILSRLLLQCRSGFQI